MPIISEQELRKHLTEGKLAGVYLLTGEEKLPLGQLARRVIDRAGGRDFPEFNCNQLTSDTPVERIVDAAVALPFMAGHKCVAVADFDPEERPADETDRLLDLLADLPETTTLVLYYPTAQMERYEKDQYGKEKGKGGAKWRKLLAQAGKAGFVVRFAQRKAGELRRDLIDQAGSQGCTMPAQVANRVIEYVGNDMHTLRSEVEKLCAYTLGQGGKEITLQAVEALTPKNTESSVFDMTSALIGGKAEKAYAILDRLLCQKEKPVRLLWLIAMPYVDMFRVKMALESGKTAFDVKEYEKCKDFRLEKAQSSLRYFSTPVLKECLDLLMEADLALKGSKLEERLVLERLLAKLMLAAQKGAA